MKAMQIKLDEKEWLEVKEYLAKKGLKFQSWAKEAILAKVGITPKNNKGA